MVAGILNLFAWEWEARMNHARAACTEVDFQAGGASWLLSNKMAVHE